MFGLVCLKKCLLYLSYNSSFYQQKCNLEIIRTIGWFSVRFSSGCCCSILGDIKRMNKLFKKQNWVKGILLGRNVTENYTRNCMNELAWTMEINRASKLRLGHVNVFVCERLSALECPCKFAIAAAAAVVFCI